MYSFRFLAIIILMRFVSNYYIMIVVILALMLILLNRIVISNNIYSKMRRYRLVALAWRYDIVLLVILLMVPKTLMMVGVMYFVLSCEVRRTPIDLIEGESELVSGFNTEFSGREFVRFFLGEYLRIVIFLVMVISCDVYVILMLYGLVI